MVYQCADGCGWMAAFCSMLAFGTFGVPIKSETCRRLDIDPLVFQSYKTTMCFLTSWLVLLAGEEFEFSPWGIVSGLFWVPGGVATIYAVKTAGLAIGIGIGSSFIVLVSFVWGIFVFDERIHSREMACVAVFCMMGGLLGMSYFSTPVEEARNEMDLNAIDATPLLDPEQQEPNQSIANGEEDGEEDGAGEDDDSSSDEEEEDEEEEVESLRSQSEQQLQVETGFADPTELMELGCGIRLQRRTVGMLAAAFCGIWGGSIMVPMKFCKSDTKGTHYLISFSIGASLVTISLWLFRLIYNVAVCRSFTKAYQNLPCFHFSVMWKPGGLSGLLWSIGNFFSLISVFYLGEGVGYPLVQTSILVSGLWGIFYFQEIKAPDRITNWLLSSLLTVVGILLLSYEHAEK